MRDWARRVDWCAVVAVPLVTLTALLDPVDTLNGAIQHLGMRLSPAARERAWPAGDVVLAEPSGRRPRGTGPRGRRPRPRTRARLRP